MANTLVIKNEVVDAFVNDCTRGISMLSSSKTFSENMAEAAGPNGGLRGALKSVEDEWWVRRGKLLDSFQKLMDTISELRKKYEELDEDMARLLKVEGGGGKDPGGGGGDQTPPNDPVPVQPQPQDPAPSPDAPGGGGGSSIPPLGSSGADAGQSVAEATQSGPSQPQPGPELPPLQDAQPLRDGDAEQGSPLSSILAFADRWAALTGRKPEEVIALLVAGMGATGLIPAALLAQLAKSAGTTIPGEVVADTGQSGIDGGQTGEQSAVDGGPVSADGSAANAEAPIDGELSTGETPIVDDLGSNLVPEAGEQVDGADVLSDVDGVTGPDTASPSEVPLQGEDVGAITAAELQPDGAGASATAEPVELPGLETAATDTPAPGGGAAAGGTGLELPPLAETGEASQLGGSSAEAIDLPELTVPSTPIVPVDGASAALPDLSISAPVTAGMGAAAMAAPTMMQGMRGMSAGGAGMATGSVSATTNASTGERSGSVEQKAEHDIALEVLEANDEEAR